MINYRHLLIYQHIGLYLGDRGDPVKEHAFNHDRHQPAPFLNCILEAPVAVCIDGEERFSGFDEVSFLGMEKNSRTPVMRVLRQSGQER